MIDVVTATGSTSYTASSIKQRGITAGKNEGTDSVAPQQQLYVSRSFTIAHSPGENLQCFFLDIPFYSLSKLAVQHPPTVCFRRISGGPDGQGGRGKSSTSTDSSSRQMVIYTIYYPARYLPAPLHSVASIYLMTRTQKRPIPA